MPQMRNEKLCKVVQPTLYLLSSVFRQIFFKNWLKALDYRNVFYV